MFSKDIDFCRMLLQNVYIFYDFQSISHFGHHLHQIKIHKNVPGYRCSKDYPITDIIFLLLDHLKKNDLIKKFDTGDINGNTPFMLFVKRFSDKEIIEKFASMGCNIHHQNKYGDNILHLLVRKNRWKYGEKYDDIKLLVSFGVDPFQQNNQRETPYSLLPESKRDEIVPLKQDHVTSINPYELLMNQKNIRGSFDMKEYLEEELGIYGLDDLKICTKELHHDIQSKLKDVPGLRYAYCYPQYFS
jgi:ankyrin repeat protein